MGWYEDLMSDAQDCRAKAQTARTPHEAKRWYEAAEAAVRAAIAMWSSSWVSMPSPVSPGNWWRCGVCDTWVMPGSVHRCAGRTTCEAAR